MRKNRFVKQKDSMHCGVACVRESSVTGSSTLKSEPMYWSPHDLLVQLSHSSILQTLSQFDTMSRQRIRREQNLSVIEYECRAIIRNNTHFGTLCKTLKGIVKLSITPPFVKHFISAKKKVLRKTFTLGWKLYLQ